MQFFSAIALQGLVALANGAILQPRDCVAGSYAVKIEAHTVGCTDPAPLASIANYGGAGPCMDTLNGHNYLKAINSDGCPSSSVDLHCYSNQDQCDSDNSGAGGAFTVLEPDSCTIAPPNCPYFRAVAG
ncbi:uncharacterized protein LTR77_010727 [Saxophila tyrrhenica]|uniref:Uncharacterized protein n=1 Tax=Saxophila tyrrhenica TaxID=1690608 RepID=A0AAV9NV35_9PEZI|nr:hypothetical protein LTR77_010727 [Saxophila tyrrhenica]